MFEDTTDRDKQQLAEVRELDRAHTDSFPMVYRCFEAQWRGLTEEEKEACYEELAGNEWRPCPIRPHWEDLGVPKEQMHWPIWTVEHIDTPLMSVKLY